MFDLPPTFPSGQLSPRRPGKSAACALSFGRPFSRAAGYAGNTGVEADSKHESDWFAQPAGRDAPMMALPPAVLSSSSMRASPRAQHSSDLCAANGRSTTAKGVGLLTRVGATSAASLSPRVRAGNLYVPLSKVVAAGAAHMARLHLCVICSTARHWQL
jgi:hypothetical protein